MTTPHRKPKPYCAGCGKIIRLRYHSVFCSMKCAARSALAAASAGSADFYCAGCGRIGCAGCDEKGGL